MKRAAMLAVLVAVIVVAFVIAKNSGSGNDNKTTTNAGSGTPVVIHVVNGQPQGGIQKITVNKGERVRFKVVSDVADEIHVHGYNFHKDVKKGGSVSFSFPATIDGIFDIELESRGEQIASLQVNQ
jgi:heme/copper-type cytochrome/quinol oxidase subunit 2